MQKIQIGAYNESRYAYILSKKKLAQNNIDLTDGIDYIGEAVLLLTLVSKFQNH